MTPSEKYIMTQETGLWYDGLRDVDGITGAARGLLRLCNGSNIVSTERRHRYALRRVMYDNSEAAALLNVFGPSVNHQVLKAQVAFAQQQVCPSLR